ncbi:MAG: PAS domain-containing sensor histidine kinase [Blastocatellia bacterium]|nr:PAS domain-containing sensor histidine kinase [Blastocatellia bacterium]
MNQQTNKSERIQFEARLWWFSLLPGLPGLLVALGLLWGGGFSFKAQITGTILLPALFGLGLVALREHVVYPLHTIANLLAALREGDFSLRGRGAQRGDALGEAYLEINALSDTLREQRLRALEATALLRSVMEVIEVAIFTFDQEERLRLTNPAGERLLAQPVERLLGQTAQELGLAECLRGENNRVSELAFPGGSGRWGIRRTTFRQQGMPHVLVVIADLKDSLREEERMAWQRLVRVLGHEINNSLTPIKSIAGSLATVAARPERPSDWEEDLGRGLGVIASRAESLSRFTAAYARLTRLPAPRPVSLDLEPLVQRVVSLETRLSVAVRGGPALQVQADREQLEQLLINLIRNGVDAVLETSGEVVVLWYRRSRFVELKVLDNGPGISNSGNLFVPFFTTKPNGSGIGLFLSRQIAEAHHGSLTLENNAAGPGCCARLELPLNQD